MKDRRRAPRPAPPALPTPADPDEAARFLREQPPIPVPRRSVAAPVPGLAAYAMLGGKVIKSGGYSV